ncbi:hypothetical protein ACFV9C_25200 [Kribbella sp. NPDC059898]|uniref:hypothetical protein n=1 Tax=Kribbella sp. NPDC059898 TaxID=3346995 RepID=UPI003665B342
MPVLDTDVAVDVRCDFCFADHTEWVLPASNFEAPVARINLFGTVGIESDERHGNAGDWGACTECAELIRANAWPKLIKRVRDCWPHVHSGNLMPEERHTNTYRLYRELRKHITGPLVPVDRVVDL